MLLPERIDVIAEKFIKQYAPDPPKKFNKPADEKLHDGLIAKQAMIDQALHKRERLKLAAGISEAELENTATVFAKFEKIFELEREIGHESDEFRVAALQEQLRELKVEFEKDSLRDVKLDIYRIDRNNEILTQEIADAIHEAQVREALLKPMQNFRDAA